MNDLRFPIGKFAPPGRLHRQTPPAARRPDRRLPATRCGGRSPGSPRRSSTRPIATAGWTVRQVVHHLPDSHMNAYVRHKLAATEELPTIRPYKEAPWAELPEARAATSRSRCRCSRRCTNAGSASCRARGGDVRPHLPASRHPGPVTLAKSVAMYAWHGRHHVAHIDALRRRRAGSHSSPPGRASARRTASTDRCMTPVMQRFLLFS